MVRFLGPFELAEGSRNTHEIDVPLYVGAVRVMVVAGHGRAFGSTEQEVPVRSPLMVLSTLPRVLAPNETIALAIGFESSVNTAQQELLNPMALKNTTFAASTSITA